MPDDAEATVRYLPPGESLLPDELILECAAAADRLTPQSSFEEVRRQRQRTRSSPPAHPPALH